MASVSAPNEKALAAAEQLHHGMKHDVETAGGAPDWHWDQDVAMAVVGEHAHAMDPTVEARVIRKIDRFMIPAMIIGYGFVYYDKVCPGPALTPLELTREPNRQFWAPPSSLV